jgi:hypothetical protein
MEYANMYGDHHGYAWWSHTREVPCTGPPQYDKCLGHTEDEYGSSHWCSACTYGNGWRIVRVRLRVPRYDAPRPPKSWKGPGKKAIDKAFA